MKHTNVNHKASFAGMEGRVSFPKVARSDLPKDCIDEIDKGIDQEQTILSLSLMYLGGEEGVVMFTRTILPSRKVIRNTYYLFTVFGLSIGHDGSVTDVDKI